MKMSLHKKRCWYLPVCFFLVLIFSISANAQTSSVKTSKKIYSKNDTVVFQYRYSGSWESVWLVVDPVKGKNGKVNGDHMTTAADLGGNPATRKFVGRFSPGTYKARIVGNSGNGSIRKDLASCVFEIKSK